MGGEQGNSCSRSQPRETSRRVPRAARRLDRCPKAGRTPDSPYLAGARSTADTGLGEAGVRTLMAAPLPALRRIDARRNDLDDELAADPRVRL
jgi:hypothetical protein